MRSRSRARRLVPGSDRITFDDLAGIDGAKARLRDLVARADAALSIFGAKGEVLRTAARFVAERKN